MTNLNMLLPNTQASCLKTCGLERLVSYRFWIGSSLSGYFSPWRSESELELHFRKWLQHPRQHPLPTSISPFMDGFFISGISSTFGASFTSISQNLGNCSPSSALLKSSPTTFSASPLTTQSIPYLSRNSSLYLNCQVPSPPTIIFKPFFFASLT